MAQQTVEVSRQSTEHPALKKVGNVAGKVAIGLAVLSGPAIGMVHGWRNARADHSRYVASEKLIPRAEAKVTTARGALTTFMDRQPLACREGLSSFLPKGLNSTFSTSTSELLLQRSGQCPTDITLVSKARSLDGDLIQAEKGVTHAKFIVEGKRQDAAENYELIQGAVDGLVLDLGLAAVGGLCYLEQGKRW